MSSGIPTSHIYFLYNIIIYNQERISVENYNFSIKENLKKVFMLCYHGKPSNAE